MKVCYCFILSILFRNILDLSRYFALRKTDECLEDRHFLKTKLWDIWSKNDASENKH